MTKREKNFCYELANFMCYPRAFEIGGVDCTMKDIIREITKNNAILFRQVMDFCKKNVSEGDYDASAYGSSDEKEVLKMIESDYYRVFY